MHFVATRRRPAALLPSDAVVNSTEHGQGQRRIRVLDFDHEKRHISYKNAMNTRWRGDVCRGNRETNEEGQGGGRTCDRHASKRTVAGWGWWAEKREGK